MDASFLIVFPEIARLRERVKKLKTELSMLILERDELEFVICKNLETAYLMKFGPLEYTVYRAQCSALRAKRRLELVQARKNRQENFLLDEIESVLDREFEEYRTKLAEQLQKMNDALRRSQSEQLSDEETRELKSLYRKIIKLVHPDLCGTQSGEFMNLYQRAVMAYKNGNLEALRIIFLLIDQGAEPEEDTDRISLLEEEEKRLVSLMESVREEMKKIRSTFPYTMKELLQSPEKTEERLRYLQSVADRYAEMEKMYEHRTASLLR